MIQREILFRCWDKDNNKMLNNIHEIWRLDSKDFTANSESHDLRLAWTDDKGFGYWRDIIPSQIIFMQFTGLKDKNGQPIFEGDILKMESQQTDIGVIEFIGNGFWINYEGKQFLPSEHLCEIIGNVHQHPTLLSK